MMFESINYKRLIFLVVLAFVLISPKIGYLDLPVLILFLLFLHRWFKDYRIRLPETFWNFILLWGLLFSIAVISFTYNGRINEILILKPLRQIILFFFIVKIFKDLKIKPHEVKGIILIASLINITVIALQLYGHLVLQKPNFLLFPNFDHALSVPFRKPGVFAGYPHSGLLSLFALTILLIERRSIKYNFFFIILLFLLLMSLVLTSRTALILSLIPLTWFFFKSIKRFNKIKNFFFLLPILIVSINYTFKWLPKDSFNVAFEAFINFSKNGSFYTESQAALNSSYLLPNNLSTYLIGNGLTNRTDFDTNIDDGYQNLIYGAGIFYFFLTLSLFYLYFLKTRSYCSSKVEKIFTSMLYFIILIANYKVDSLFSRLTSEIFTMYLVSSYYSKLEIHWKHQLK